MQRLTLLSIGGIGLIAIFLLFKTLFSVPSSIENPPQTEQVGISSSGAAMASSLNLIVRVSPRLTQSKQDTSSSVSRSEPAAKNDTLYQPYTSSVLLKGKSTLLFFAQTDDPFSLSHEEMILSLAIAKKLTTPVFRVDFANTSMKLEYGVIVPDTFVLLDAMGERLESIIHPSSVELRTLLTSSSQ